MRGVSSATVEWRTTPHDTSPMNLSYVEVDPVFVAPTTVARLWGAGEAAVRYHVRKGTIRLGASGRRDVVHLTARAGGISSAAMADGRTRAELGRFTRKPGTSEKRRLKYRDMSGARVRRLGLVELPD